MRDTQDARWAHGTYMVMLSGGRVERASEVRRGACGCVWLCVCVGGGGGGGRGGE